MESPIARARASSHNVALVWMADVWVAQRGAA